MVKSVREKNYTNLSLPIHLQTSCLYKHVLLGVCYYMYLVVKEKEKPPKLLCPRYVRCNSLFRK